MSALYYATTMAHFSDIPGFERQETPEVEAQVLAKLRDAFDQVDQLYERYKDWSIEPGTSIYGDDAALPYEPISHQLQTSIGVAFDNLRTVRLIVESGNIPVFAHFGLIRNALEAIGVGLWTLGPASRDERVLRALQISLEDRKDINSLDLTMGGATGTATRLPTDDKVRVRLEEIRETRPGLRGKSLDAPSITSRLVAAQEYANSFPFTLLVAWKLTSGFSHGRRATMLATLDRQVTNTFDIGVEVRMTSNFTAIGSMYKTAVHYLMRLLVLLMGRNGTPLDI